MDSTICCSFPCKSFDEIYVLDSCCIDCNIFIIKIHSKKKTISKIMPFSRVEKLIGKNNVEKLSNSHVVVCGIGGVGSYSAEALVRSGVGKITIIDYDVIDISNCNRQLWALHSTIGKIKVDVAAERLQDINPNLKLIKYQQKITEENISELLDDNPDFVIDAIDSLTSKAALITYLKLNNLKFISCLGAARRLDPLKIEITDLFKTHGCPLALKLRKLLREKSIIKDIPVVWSYENPQSIETEKPLPSICFVPAAIGLMAASYTIEALIK